MAKYNIPISVNIPDEMDITLVRSDYYDISNIFRIVFEISIAVFSGILGYLFSQWPWSLVHFLLIVILIAIIIFSLLFMIRYHKKSKQHELESDENIGDIPFKNFHLAINIPIEQKPGKLANDLNGYKKKNKLDLPGLSPEAVAEWLNLG